jgi:hypothetical protein
MMMRLTLWFLTSTGQVPIERLVPPAVCVSLAPQIIALEIMHDHPSWVFQGRYTCNRHREMKL